MGIDPSLTCSGVAMVTWHPGTDFPDPSWQTWRGRAPKPEIDTVETTRRRIRVMLRESLAFIPAHVDLIVIEGASYGSRTGMSKAHERAGLWWMLTDQLLPRGPMVRVTPSQRAALATGRGGAGSRKVSAREAKATVLARVRALVPAAHIPDHNVGDAVALAAAGAHALGLRMPYTAEQEQAHGRVSWPVGSAGLLAGNGVQ